MAASDNYINKDKILNNHNKEFININDSEIENNYLYEITYIFSNLEIKSKNKVVKKKPKQKSKWRQLFCCCR